MSFQAIYSRVEPARLLHVVCDALGGGADRIDVSPTEQHLQVSVIPLAAGRQVRPHIHQPRVTPPPQSVITQESWLVLRGRIRVRLFDLDQALLEECELGPGSFLVTYGGGHALECLEENTVMLEYKNGPYLGRDFKTFAETDENAKAP